MQPALSNLNILPSFFKSFSGGKKDVPYSVEAPYIPFSIFHSPSSILPKVNNYSEFGVPHAYPYMFTLHVHICKYVLHVFNFI